MDLLREFKGFVVSEHLFYQKDRLLLAVSGGVDSVVLCELCKQAGFDFSIAHCNFQLREVESERDEEFVRALGSKYGVAVFVKRFDTEDYAKQQKVSIQVAARELRYHWFGELLAGTPGKGSGATHGDFSLAEQGEVGDQSQQYPVSPSASYNFLLTAHHLDDNIETMLMNFFKGTGIAGLRGILPKQGKIVRPLLFAKKEELQAFASEFGLDWVLDSSNESDKYARNHFRHHLIPLIQKVYPEAENNLADNLQRFRDIEMLYQQSIDQHKKKLMERKGNEIHIPVLKLKKSEPLHSIVFEIVKDFGFHAAQVNEVIDLLDSGTGKYIASVSHRVIKNRAWLIIAPVAGVEANHVLIEKDATVVEFAPDSQVVGHLQLERSVVGDSKIAKLQGEGPGVPDRLAGTSLFTALLDIDEIKFPLILRKWKAGDYFYPLGMRKKKKISRFLIDQKISRTDKEKVWVLEMDKKIIWVIGHRIDDRFKIVQKTKEVLKITFS